jgi:hypothetical protein
MRIILRLLLAVVAIAGLAGCAAAHRDYPCGVHYRYCRAWPLPFRNYAGCPTPVAAEHLSQCPAPAEASPAP